MNKIPVVFSINDKYIKQLSTVLVSIMENCSEKTLIEANILHTDITTESQSRVMQLISKYKNLDIVFKDVSECLKNINLEEYMSYRTGYKYITSETYFRFLIPDIFKNYDKIIYLDSDILVLDDITKLYNENIDGYYVGAVQDTFFLAFLDKGSTKTSLYPNMHYKDYFKNYLKKTNTNYFNAGVLLLNIKKINEDKKNNELWKYTFEKSPLELQDQDVLNAVFESNVKYLDYKWNVLKDLKHQLKHIKDKPLRKKLEKIYAKPSIFHYVWSNKPWLHHNDNYDYSFILDWWKYYKKTTVFEENDLEILDDIKREVSKLKEFYYVSLVIFNFVFLEIKEYRNHLKIKVLNLIKFNINKEKRVKYTRNRNVK